MTQWPPGGALFTNTKKKSDRAPDFNGNIQFSQELIDYLVAMIEEDPDEYPKLEISGWRKKSKSGTPWTSLAASNPYEHREEFQRRQARPTKGNRGPVSNEPSMFDVDDDEIPF